MTPYALGLNVGMEKEAWIGPLLRLLGMGLKSGWRAAPMLGKGAIKGVPAAYGAAGPAARIAAKAAQGVGRVGGFPVRHPNASMLAMIAAPTAIEMATGPSAADRAKAEEAQSAMFAKQLAGELQPGVPAEEVTSPAAPPAKRSLTDQVFGGYSLGSGPNATQVSPGGAAIGGGAGYLLGKRLKVNPWVTALLLGGAGALATPHIAKAFNRPAAPTPAPAAPPAV